MVCCGANKKMMQQEQPQKSRKPRSPQEAEQPEQPEQQEQLLEQQPEQPKEQGESNVGSRPTLLGRISAPAPLTGILSKSSGAASSVKSGVSSAFHKSRDAISSHMPSLHAIKTEEAAVEAPPPAASAWWCGVSAAPWSCCQEGMGHEEGELNLQSEQPEQRGESTSGLLPTLLGRTRHSPREEGDGEGKHGRSPPSEGRQGSRQPLPGLLSRLGRRPSDSGTWHPKSPDSAEARADSRGADATSQSNILGAMVQKLVAGFDEGLLGVKVHTESMKLEPLSGAVELQGLQVDNPQGFRSKYLLRAGKVAVRVNMSKLVSSFGGTVEVDEVTLDQVDVIYEKSLRTSNLDTLLHKIGGDGGETAGGGSSTQASSNSSASDVKVVLHQIEVCNVGAKVCTSLSAMAGPRLAVGDIHFEDFDKSSGGATGLMQVVKLVLSTLIRSILASILGKSAENGMAKAASGVTSSMSHALHKSKAAISSHMPLHHHSNQADAMAEAQAPPAASAWHVPWSCCQEGVRHEEAEVVVSQ